MSKVEHRITKHLDNTHPPIFISSKRCFVPRRIEVVWETWTEGKEWELGRVTASDCRDYHVYERMNHGSIPVWLAEIVEETRPQSVSGVEDLHVTNMRYHGSMASCRVTADVTGTPPVRGMGRTEFLPTRVEVVYRRARGSGSCTWVADNLITVSGDSTRGWQSAVVCAKNNGQWVNELVDKLRPGAEASVSDPAQEAELLTAYNKVLTAKKEHEDALAAWTALVGGGSV